MAASYTARCWSSPASGPRQEVPVVLVANKSEARGSDAGFYDAYTLGLGEPVPISAEHGQGMIDLRDATGEFGRRDHL